MAAIATDRAPVPPADPFRRKLARFAARSIRLRTLRARAHPPLVSFTFDDVPESAATLGAAILEEKGLRGTFYISGRLTIEGEPGRTLAGPELCRTLHSAGHEIGCHTYAHRHVAAMSGAGLAADLTRNGALLAELAPGAAPVSFAYPFNAPSLLAKHRLSRRFATCRGGVPGINAGRIDPDYLRAVELADGFIDAAGAKAWIDEAVARSGWLVFFSHGIADQPEPWGCRPALLRAAVETATASGARVVTMREAYSIVSGAGEAQP